MHDLRIPCSGALALIVSVSKAIRDSIRDSRVVPTYRNEAKLQWWEFKDIENCVQYLFMLLLTLCALHPNMFDDNALFLEMPYWISCQLSKASFLQAYNPPDAGARGVPMHIPWKTDEVRLGTNWKMFFVFPFPWTLFTFDWLVDIVEWVQQTQCLDFFPQGRLFFLSIAKLSQSVAR